VAPLDAYAHALIRRHIPELAAQVRVIAETEPVPIPLLVAAAALPAATRERLRAAFVTCANDAVAQPLLDELELAGFVEPLPHAAYAVMERWAREAEAAGRRNIV
jgi:ABC-type phosphate/phosphonate transport system substrate-binding protein